MKRTLRGQQVQLLKAAAEAEGYGLKVKTVYHTGAFLATIEGNQLQIERYLAALEKYLPDVAVDKAAP